MARPPERPVKAPQGKPAPSQPSAGPPGRSPAAFQAKPPLSQPQAAPPVAPLVPNKPAAGPLPTAPAAGSPFGKLLNAQPSNKHLFLILGGLGAVLFMCLTSALLYSLVGGGSSGTASNTGPMFPDDTKGSPQANPGLPRNPGKIARKPRQAAEGFFFDLMENRIEDAFDRTSRFYGQTRDQFREIMELNRPFRRFTDFKMVASSSEASDVVSYRGHVSGPNGPADFEIEVVQEGDGWLVRQFVPQVYR